jgi:chemotaxis protein methyltransferase CheR
MARSGIDDVERYARLLETDGQAIDHLIVELTVGETYFFREPNQFDYIRRHILSEIRERQGPAHTIRIWTAACASGEETYSLAMLCERAGLAEKSSILATDISPAALAKAEHAVYGEWSLRGEGALRAKEYLRREGDEYRVDPQIRGRVHFEFLNLALDVYPSLVTGTEAMDLILCRNVLIYFDRDTIRAVAARLFDCLADGGWLLLASGDPPIDEYARFETVIADGGVFYRKPCPKRAGAAHKTPRTTAWLDRSHASFDGQPALAPPPNRSVPEPRVAPRAPATAPDGQADPVAQARAALAAGDYSRAAELTRRRPDDPTACALQVKAMANIDTGRAASLCGQLTESHPLSPELHYLHAVLLMETNQDEQAVQATRRAVFLDRSLALAHFLLGSILQQRGALEGARRSFRNAHRLCESQPPQELVALSEHDTNGQLARAAELHLAAIDAALRNRP